MKTILLAIAALLTFPALTAACAAPTDSAATDSAALAADSPAVRIDATWSRVVTGTPTYGFDATTPALSFSVRVTDREIRREHPDFDGLEQPFVVMPRADGSTTRFALPFRYTTSEGFIELYPVDVYANNGKAFFVTEADLALIRERGVELEVETNVGTISLHAVVEAEHSP